MCTLTYIPLENENFIFTTNRDESPDRNALAPDIYMHNNMPYLYPKDTFGKGTWMLCSVEYCICLLNGAFQKHTYNPPYKKSRGVVVLDYSTYKNTVDFILNFDFKGIEPFTMVIVSCINKLKVEEIRWDSSSIHYQKLDSNKPNIWSSSTLYNAEAKQLRKKWFNNWNKNKDYSANRVMDFHKNTGKDDPINGLIMNRKEIVKTTSITQIVKKDKILQMHYEDLKNEHFVERFLKN
jgi:hypothetical protein